MHNIIICLNFEDSNTGFLASLVINCFFWCTFSLSYSWLIRTVFHSLNLAHCYSIFPFTVLKFKRRTRFLGFFVQVFAKALQEGLTEIALEWCNDAIAWMIRYAEIDQLLVP